MAEKTTVESLLPDPLRPRAGGILSAPETGAVNPKYAGFFAQTSQYIAQGTHQSLAKYFGIADKMGFTDALTEPEFNALKGQRQMTYRPGFSRQTWDNEIDAFDIGDTLSRLEQNGMDNTFSMVVGSILGGFTDPVNVAGTYLAPMIGAMAVGANALSRGAVAAAIRKGGPEAVIKFLSASPTGYFQQVKRAAIFGAAEGAAEIPADKYLSELTGQRTYTAADAGLNILTGAALNATIAGVDPAVMGTLRAVQKRWSKSFRETNTFAGQLAAKGINDGRPVTVAEVEANVAKMDTYQPSAKRQVERTDGKKAMTPERATPAPQRVSLTVPDVTHPSGAPLDFKGDDVSKGLYAVAGGNKDVEDQLMRALIDNGTFHADVPSTREALQQAAAEIKTKVDAQGPSVKAVDSSQAPEGAQPLDEGHLQGDDAKNVIAGGRPANFNTADPSLNNDFVKYDNGDGVAHYIAEAEAMAAYEASTKPVKVKVDGIPTLARIRDKVTPKADPQLKGAETDVEMQDRLKDLADMYGIKVNFRKTKRGDYTSHVEEIFVPPHHEKVDEPQGNMRSVDIFAHELSHAILDKRSIESGGPAMRELNTKDIPDFKVLQAEARRLRPTTKEHPQGYVDYVNQPEEVLADVMASVLRGTTPRSILEPFFQKHGLAGLHLGTVPSLEVAHTIRPSDHDLLVGQDYKATRIAAIDNEGNQMIRDMEEYGRKYGDMTDETIQADVAHANKIANIANEIGVCPKRPKVVE